MADGEVNLDQAITDALRSAPAEADQQSASITGNLTPPQQVDPLSQLHPAVAQEIQRQQQQGPPRMGGVPLLARYIGGMIKGPQQASPLSAPTSRGDMTLNFLGELLANMSQGLAQAGHGPGANLRGFAGGVQAPYQRELSQYQLGQQQQAQQAQIQGEQARTGLAQAQTGQVTTETELMRRRIAAMQSGALGSGPIAALGELSSDEKAIVGAAQQEAAIKGDQTPLLQAVEKITNQRAISGRMGGNATIIPDANSTKTGLSKVIRDRTGKVIDIQKDTVVPGMAGKVTTTERIEKDAEGNLVRVPVTTTTTPVIPGGKAKGGGVPSAANVPTSNRAARPILNADGTPLHQPMGQTAKNSLFKIDSALSLADRVRPDLESVTDELKRGGNLWDSVQQRSAWEQYQKLGIDPSNVDPNSIVSQLPNVDPRLARLMPTIAMLQIVGAQPYLQGVRRFEFIKQIQSHLPDPSKDTPQLMVSKLQQLNRNLPALEAALYKSEGITPKMDAAMAQRYLNMAGGSKDKARVMGKTDGWDF